VGIASYDDHDRAIEWAASRGIREHDLVEALTF
jgi:succinate dehydrogenase flavin-adding protein (antitoxin of CptAB toxin-antitoxin module)